MPHPSSVATVLKGPEVFKFVLSLLMVALYMQANNEIYNRFFFAAMMKQLIVSESMIC